VIHVVKRPIVQGTVLGPVTIICISPTVCVLLVLLYSISDLLQYIVMRCSFIKQLAGPSIYDVHTDGEGVKLRWTPADGGGGKRHVAVLTEN